MDRVPEPELMDDAAQALAYSEADFEKPHQFFVDLYRERFPEGPGDCVLDLGCGPADVTVRFARAFPSSSIDGVDGAGAMIKLGNRRVAAAGLDDRVRLHVGYLPGAELPRSRYASVVSNSLLHHLQDADVLWNEIHHRAEPAADVFVMDLMRPDSEDTCQNMLDQYAAGEPEVLRRDFLYSLRAAYRCDEVESQLRKAGLAHLKVEPVTDRHFVVYGRMPG